VFLEPVLEFGTGVIMGIYTVLLILLIFGNIKLQPHQKKDQN
jgi:hypothetical protein